MKFFATNAVFQIIIYHCINISKWLFYKFIVIGEIALFYSHSEYTTPNKQSIIWGLLFQDG